MLNKEVILPTIYNRLAPIGKAYLDYFRFSAGMLPRIAPNNPPGQPFVVITIDFELAWASRYSLSSADPQAKAIAAALRTRENMPLLLGLFDRFEVPATWATVGHLFLERCDRCDGIAHKEMPRPPFFKNDNWQFDKGDWYDDDPCSSFLVSPEWYAPDLIRDIMSRSIKHEIGCHTFSHIPCNQDHCPPDLLRAELQECNRLASEWGLNLHSFVFPANIVGNLSVLSEFDFQVYRFNDYYHLALPQWDEYGMLRIPGGFNMERPAYMPMRLWVKILSLCIERAIQTGTVLHLWLHPSCSQENITCVLPAVLNLITSKKEIITIRRMKDFI